MKKKIEVCLSPALYPLYDTNNSITVVVDILRATSVITTMFMNGVKEVIPVKDIETAKKYKDQGFTVVAERDGKKLDFADFGNSPYYFKKEVVAGKTLVYSTTNGTNAISLGINSKSVLIGSYLNFSAITEHLIKSNNNIVLLAAGWKDKFNIEDTLFCGAVVENLLATDQFTTICDSSIMAMDLWKIAKQDITKYIEKAAQKTRLKKMGLDNVIDYCHQFDKTDIIPIYKDKSLIKL